MWPLKSLELISDFCKTASTSLKAADEILFGGPGEVGGLFGKLIDSAGKATGGSATTATSRNNLDNPLSTTLLTKINNDNSKNPNITAEELNLDLIKSANLTAKEADLYVISGFVARQVAGHIADNYLKETVYPIKGSVVYCDLALVAEHSGIYVGDGNIAHLDGSGNMEIVTHKKFLARLGGLNPSMSIYVSCLDDNAVGNAAAAERAIAMAGNYTNYHTILNNCHQFTSGCITGNFENSDNFWWMLKDKAEHQYGANSWRTWKMST